MPLHMARVLTYPERATEANLMKLRARVAAGAASWPGANFVGLPDGARVWLRDERVRRKYATELKVRRSPVGCNLAQSVLVVNATACPSGDLITQRGKRVPVLLRMQALPGTWLL